MFDVKSQPEFMSQNASGHHESDSHLISEWTQLKNWIYTSHFS